MHLVWTPRGLHFHYHFSLFLVGLNSPFWHHKAQKIFGLHTESTLGQIKLHLMSTQHLKGFPLVHYMVVGLFSLYQQIIHIDLQVLSLNMRSVTYDILLLHFLIQTTLLDSNISPSLLWSRSSPNLPDLFKSSYTQSMRPWSWACSGRLWNLLSSRLMVRESYSSGMPYLGW